MQTNRLTTAVNLGRALIERVQEQGWDLDQIEEVLRTFLSDPDPHVPRRRTQSQLPAVTVRLDAGVMSLVQAFVAQQRRRLGGWVRARDVIEQVLLAELDPSWASRLPAEQPAPISSGRTTSIGLERALVERMRPHGAQATLVEQAIRAFLANPDLAVPRPKPLARPIQVVRVDSVLLAAIRQFAKEQSIHRGSRVTNRAVVEEILAAFLDELDRRLADAPTAE